MDNLMRNFLATLTACLTLLLSVSPALASYTKNAQVFGGNGSTVRSITGTVTETYTQSFQYRSYTSGAGSTHNVISGTTFNSVGPVVISGAVVGTGGSSGGEGGYGIAGDKAGSGGSCVGEGGFVIGGQGNRAGGFTISIHPGITGSGGQSSAKSNDAAGVGGVGGARLVFCSASSITVNGSGSIACNGTNGGGSNNGGGGGSGGVIGLFSLTSVTCASGSNLSAKGGNGGPGSNYAGCGGGGGLIYVMAPTVSLLGTTNVSPGSKGTGGGTGQDGSAGQVVSIAGVPCLPLVIWMMDHPSEMKQIAALHNGRLDAVTVKLIAFGDGIREKSRSRVVDLFEERRCVA